MNTKLFELIRDNKEFTMNPVVLRGYAQHALHWKLVEAHIEQNIRDTYEGILDGLVFEGLSYTTYQERIKESMVKLQNTTYLPHDHTDCYYLKAQFSYQGRKLKPHFIKIPFLRDGGVTTIRNSKYYVSPVIVDSGISVHKVNVNEGKHQAFLWLQRSNLQINTESVRIQTNGMISSQRLITLDLNQANKKDRQVKTNHPRYMNAETPAIIYLLVKYGLMDAAKKFFDLDLILSDLPYDELADDYPYTEWMVCSADSHKQLKLNIERWKTPTLSIIIPRDKWGVGVSEFITGVLYLVNWFPKLLTKDNLEDEGDPTGIWKIACGDVMYNTGESDVQLLEKVNRHLTTSVELMLNPITANELRNDGIEVYDMYELIAYIVKNVSNTFNYKQVNNLQDKKLACLRYFLEPFTASITHASYGLAKLQEQVVKGDIVSLEKIHETIGSKKKFCKGLKTTLFDKIHTTCGMFNNEQSASDNMYFKITCKMISQDSNQKRTKKAGGGKRGQLTAAKNFYHPSYLTIGRTIFQPKKNPTGGGEINPYINITPSGHFKPDRKYQWLVDEAVEHLSLNTTTVDTLLTDDDMVDATTQEDIYNSGENK